MCQDHFVTGVPTCEDPVPGGGVPKAVISRVFRRFKNAPPARRRSHFTAKRRLKNTISTVSRKRSPAPSESPQDTSFASTAAYGLISDSSFDTTISSLSDADNDPDFCPDGDSLSVTLSDFVKRRFFDDCW